jgi:adenylosuccinate lyase
VKNWNVHPARMERNIHLTKGLIFSQRVMLALTKKDISREQAYQLVQKNSLRAWNENLDFKDLVLQDPEILKVLSEGDITDCFTLDPYLEKIDYIFDKVFADEN